MLVEQIIRLVWVLLSCLNLLFIVVDSRLLMALIPMLRELELLLFLLHYLYHLLYIFIFYLCWPMTWLEPTALTLQQWAPSIFFIIYFHAPKLSANLSYLSSQPNLLIALSLSIPLIVSFRIRWVDGKLVDMKVVNT